MAKGSAFFAANFSRQLDGLNVPVHLRIATIDDVETGNAGSGASFKKDLKLFPVKTKFGASKIISFSKDKDL